MFDSASAERPMVLILEDLHWAAAPSLLLLRHLARAKDPAALLIVGTFRDTELERSHPLASILADFRPDDGVTRVSLKGLDQEGVLAYVEASTGFELDDQGRSFAATLYDEASGNPLFIGEVLRHLIETGVVSEADGHWTFDADPWTAVPASVRDVISRRIGRLPPPAQMTLSVAACCGAEFELSWLERALDGGDAILQDLDRAVGARIVDELPVSGRYTFSHTLIRRTLYDELSLTRRSRIHRQLGLAIEETHSADLAPFFASLCFHFAKASDPKFTVKAATYALAAAQRLLSQLAVEEALQQVTIGLDLIALEARPDRALRADLQMARAQALLFSGQISESKAAATAAAEDARTVRSPGRMVAAAAALGWHSSPGVIDPLLPQLCAEALQITGSGDPEVRSRALATLAVYRGVNEGETVEAGPLAAESVALARSMADPYLLWQALYARSHVLWPTEFIAERLSIAEEMVNLATEIEEVEPRYQSRYFRGVVRLEGTDRGGFEADLADVEGLAADHHQYWVPAAVTNLWKTLLLLLDGRIADAETRVFSGLRAVPRSDLIFRTSFVAQLFAIRREQGRLIELIPGFESMVEQQSLVAIHAGIALAHAEVGALDRARELLADLATDGFASLRRDSTWTVQLADVADVVSLAGAREHAASVYQLLEPKAGELIVASPGCFCAGAVDRYLGMMAELLGQVETARLHYEQALRLETGIGSEPLVARTKVSYARLLIRHGDEQDRALATALIDQSLATSRRLGLVALERAATSLQSTV
jgi:tetratricopeptide (TPR) repeat protein